MLSCRRNYRHLWACWWNTDQALNHGFWKSDGPCSKDCWPKEGSGFAPWYTTRWEQFSRVFNFPNVCSLVLRRARVHTEVEWSGKWFGHIEDLWPSISAFSSTLQGCPSSHAIVRKSVKVSISHISNGLHRPAHLHSRMAGVSWSIRPTI